MTIHDTDRERTEDGYSVQCVQCEKWFTSSRYDASFCSSTCRSRHHRAAAMVQKRIDAAHAAIDALITQLPRHGETDTFKALDTIRRRIDSALSTVETEDHRRTSSAAVQTRQPSPSGPPDTATPPPSAPLPLHIEDVEPLPEDLPEDIAVLPPHRQRLALKNRAFLDFTYHERRFLRTALESKKRTVTCGKIEPRIDRLVKELACFDNGVLHGDYITYTLTPDGERVAATMPSHGDELKWF